jgi:hypothetical protein
MIASMNEPVILQDGRSLHGLMIVNPFRPDNDAPVDHILPP